MILSMKNLADIWMGQKQAVFSTEEGDYYWDDFFYSVQYVIQSLGKEKDWGVFFENPAQFSVAFWALLSSGKNIHCYSDLSTGAHEFPLLTDDISLSAIPVTLQKSMGKNGISPGKNEASDSLVVLYTSGSTGESKKIEKPISLIDREVQELFKLWGEHFLKSQTYSTVSHQHFYGLLFSILLPNVSVSTIQDKRLAFPESLSKLSKDRITLIGSPAFLKRIRALSLEHPFGATGTAVFSSGGFLPGGVAEQCQQYFKQPVFEIYGSTETGGIAWKVSPRDISWRSFDCVSLELDSNGNALIRSEYMEEHLYSLDDELEMLADGSFTLHGRKDSIVKVEDKRVSLNEIENRLMETSLVSDVFVTMMEGNRQYIAAVIELNKQGQDKFKDCEKKEQNRWFRHYLTPYFHPTILPKKWRYPHKISRNTQGKINRTEMVEMFHKKHKENDLNMNRISDLPVIHSKEMSDNQYTSLLSFPENYRYFDGHFPEMKILPALAQINWVLSVVNKEFDVPLPIRKIPRLKFKNPIFPEQKVSLKITYLKERSRINFEYRKSESSILMSSGNINLEEIS